ncbi:DUF4234 domain-containing protein [uncultured Brachyspira sp.]|uniref:DUF4234 domain-containing protein n=1 Tax=uncultured Brachyspira sp. TaxID=221953 RepID=UPI002601CB52|nr:DUF4234 domain-containing protein [uncultured Brachyspira sp.]
MKRGTVRSIPMLILLSIVTCGIYYLYWIYKTTDEIKNFMEREDINPTLELILVLVTGNIYGIYWYYKYSKTVYSEMTAKAGINNSEDSTVLLVVLGVLFPIAAGAIMQDKLNTIWKSIDDSANTVSNIENN